MTLPETNQRIKARITDVLHTRLLAWYRRHQRDLPWRRKCEPYAILVSELMLQQTRVATVIPYYERWMKAFPSIQALARANIDAVLRHWAGLGYYSRARNLHDTAQAVVNRHRGKIPSDPLVLRTLPGIGAYTAGAIASIAFNRRAPILDGNVIRVLSRLFLVRDDTAKASVRDHLWKLAEEIIPNGHARDFNQALMELGALVCLPREPKCAVCPMANVCRARATGAESKLPILRKRQTVRSVRQFAMVLRRGNQVLLQRRTTGQLMAGLWVFPRLESRNAIRKQLPGIPTRAIGAVTHSVMNQRITVNAVLASVNGGAFSPAPCGSSRWMPVHKLDTLALPSADRRLAALIR